MKAAKLRAKPTSLHCLVCKFTQLPIYCRREEKHGAAVYLSAVKSRYSYFAPEVQARLVKAVSIIFYWKRCYLKLPTVSIEVSAKVGELILEERHDRKMRRLAWKCETRNVDLSENVPDAHLELSENKVQVSWPQFVQDAFHFDVHYNRVHLILTLSLPRSISNFSCSLTRNITSDSMENLAFQSLLRWKMIILPILTTSLLHFSLKGWENVTFWSWEWKVDLTMGKISCFPKVHLDWLVQKRVWCGIYFCCSVQCFVHYKITHLHNDCFNILWTIIIISYFVRLHIQLCCFL